MPSLVRRGRICTVDHVNHPDNARNMLKSDGQGRLTLNLPMRRPEAGTPPSTARVPALGHPHRCDRTEGAREGRDLRDSGTSVFVRSRAGNGRVREAMGVRTALIAGDIIAGVDRPVITMPPLRRTSGRDATPLRNPVGTLGKERNPHVPHHRCCSPAARRSG